MEEMKFPVCSERMKKYFISLQEGTEKIYGVARAARAKGYDPEERVDIPIAAFIPEKVEALIASVMPQVENSGVKERIRELDKQYSAGDWRVAFIIAAEVAQEKFCKFDTKLDAVTTGIRIGLAYVTQGVVSAPLEGIVECKFKKRRDGKEYLALFYAGPIRGAGGTGQSISVILADYVRKQCGIDRYDPSEDEIKRTHTEITDYYDRVERKQYKPSFEETAFIVKNLPVEIDGDPTAELEVSNYKYMDRVETNRIRGGMALVYLDGLTLKAAKLWRQLAKWGKDFGLDEWKWLQEFVDLKARLHEKRGEKKEVETGDPIKPDYYYLSEIVAGRPVFSYPMAKGGFRLRYGRTRMTGDGSWAISPMTMHVLNDYLAIGSQLRVERPGKSTALTVCETIDGPVVKLKDGSVLKLNDEATALKYKKDIDEIISIGDLLISHGDFVEQNHRLMPSPYVPEWWVLDVAEAMKEKKTSIPPERITELLAHSLRIRPTFDEATTISKELDVPLHPDWCFRWKETDVEGFEALRVWLKNNPGIETEIPEPKVKRTLELIACSHWVRNGKLVFDADVKRALELILGEDKQVEGDVLERVNKLSPYKFLDVAGYSIGARMGRPEKAKMRELKGSPNGLFPIGKEGDRLRSLQKALEVGYVTADFPTFYCSPCNHHTIYPVCEMCGVRTQWIRRCPICKKETTDLKCHKETLPASKQKIDINHYFNNCKAYLKMSQVPPLVKGIRGTSSKTHICEHMAKALLRAKNNLVVNKDGTVRFDGSELGITHFTSNDVGTPVKKLIELGYTADIHGEPLEREDQVLEIYPQDILLPACPEAAEEGADKVMMRVAKFIDDELVAFYHQKPFFKMRSRDDLVGHLVIGLAPHTSAGIMSRIIGFSKTQAIFAHPYWHAVQRRDLDGEETSIMLALDAFLNFSRQYLPDRRGARFMDAPLLVSTILNPAEVDDEVYDVDACWFYPKEFYLATLKFSPPNAVPIDQLKNRIRKPEQYEGIGYTHEVRDMNAGVRMSAYKSIPTMVEKMEGQMDLATRIRAVDRRGVGTLVIEKHFIRDIKGNLRKLSIQQYRCVKCNEKFRRPPLAGICNKCGGKLLFTISEGTIKKYLEPSLKLARDCDVSPYLKQTLDILKRMVDSIFGEEKTKQMGLGGFFK